MKKKTKLHYEELNKRVNEVFDMNEGEKCYGLFVEDNGTVRVCLGRQWLKRIWLFTWNMTERPEALQYLMGERDSFSD